MQLPVLFGKYELTEFLGGGMSRVFKARDTVLNRTVAVKILTPEGTADPDTRARFLAEAKMSASLVHDHIIRIFDYGEEQGYPFIVMEFLTGCDLKHAIKENRLGGLEDKLRVAIESSEALQHVHEQKLIHRDIKPDNIHIDTHGRVRLMDFGIAKSEDLSLTKTGFQVGTPFYMAPEQVNGEKATERSDVYSFGLVIFEIFTGVKAIEGTTIAQVFSAILHQQVDFSRMAAYGAPPDLVALVSRMGAKDPAQRPASFLEVIAELKRIAASLQPATATPIPASAPAKGFSGRKMMAGLIGLIMVLTAVTVYMVFKNRAELEGRTGGGAKLEPTITTETGEMKLVAGGPFKWGNEGFETVLPAFYVDKTEVTNESYRKFCAAKNRQLPEGLSQADARMPVVNVAAIDAKDFCAWAGKRLPLPLEWEKAARGTDLRPYPWGTDADPAKANVADNPTLGGKSLAAADSMPEGASPSGALHMTGNVLEWVDEARAPSAGAVEAFSKLLNPPPSATEPWYLIKGGAFDRPLAHGILHEWITVPARFTAPDIGFRCIQVPKQ